MVERSRHESSRELLEEIEDGWATSPIRLDAAGTGSAAIGTEGASAEADADAERPSDPDLAALDEGWLDELFPEGGEDEADDDDDDAVEPELPDERLDPEAFALAKKARDERAARRKEKKRTKAEAKRARQKARAAAMRQKQKAKKARPAAPARRAEPSARRVAVEERPRSTRPGRTASEPDVAGPSHLPRTDGGEAERRQGTRTSRAPARVRRPDTMASIKLLAIVLALLLAIAAAIAAIVR